MFCPASIVWKYSSAVEELGKEQAADRIARGSGQGGESDEEPFVAAALDMIFTCDLKIEVIQIAMGWFIGFGWRFLSFSFETFWGAF